MRSNPLYAQCLRRAADLLGGYRELGARIGVAPPLLERWGSGKSAAPEKVFLAVVDVLLEAGAGPPPAPGPGGTPRPL